MGGVSPRLGTAPGVPEPSARARVTPQDIRWLCAARDRYLSRDEVVQSVRSVVRRSWSRCALLGVEPDRRRLEVMTEPRLEAPVLRAAEPMLETLGHRVHGTGAAVLLTDAMGALAAVRGDAGMRRLLGRVQAVPGAVLNETATGTNAVGTAVAEGVGIQICSAEHLIDAFQGFACTAIPIRHPLSGRIVAVLDVTTRDREVSRAVWDMVVNAARQIERRLVDQLTARERALLVHYLREIHRSRAAIVASDGRTTMTSAEALRLLEPADYALLVPYIEQGRRASGTFQREVTLTSGEAVRLEVSSTLDGGETVGVIVRIRRLARAPERVMGPCPMDPFAHLVGQHEAFRQAIELARAAVPGGLPVAIMGEPGTGKYALAEALAAAIGGRAWTIACAGAGESVESFTADVRARLNESAVVIFRLVDALSPAAQRALVSVLDETQRKPGARLIATVQETRSPQPSAGSSLRRDLFDRLAVVQIRLPALRERREDVPLLARALLDQLDGGRQRRLSPVALQILSQADLPGNVRHLRNVLQRALLLAPGREITARELPDEVVEGARRPHLSRFEEAELEALRRALREVGGNRRRAAAVLGISRSTLYRKLERYGSMVADLTP